jgi:hypothetical protein
MSDIIDSPRPFETIGEYEEWKTKQMPDEIWACPTKSFLDGGKSLSAGIEKKFSNDVKYTRTAIHDKLVEENAKLRVALKSTLRELWDELHDRVSEKQFDDYFKEEIEALANGDE